MIPGPRFQDALVYTCTIHDGQIRKKTGMPRVAHLISVAGLVLEHGGTEDEGIGALLHDAVEDAGGWPRLDDIQLRFGDAVTALVRGCTESDITPRPPWRERKQAYVQHLMHGSDSIQFIAAADKLHNARALRRGLAADGDRIWEKYKGGRAGTIWYYRALIEVLRRRAPGQLISELTRVVDEIEELARHHAPPAE